METPIIVAMVTGAFGLVGSVIVALISSRVTRIAVTQQLQIAQAVTDTKLEELTREVRKHNNFAERVPVLEERVKHLEQRGA